MEAWASEPPFPGFGRTDGDERSAAAPPASITATAAPTLIAIVGPRTPAGLGTCREESVQTQKPAILSRRGRPGPAGRWEILRAEPSPLSLPPRSSIFNVRGVINNGRGGKKSTHYILMSSSTHWREVGDLPGMEMLDAPDYKPEMRRAAPRETARNKTLASLQSSCCCGWRLPL